MHCTPQLDDDAKLMEDVRAIFSLYDADGRCDDLSWVGGAELLISA
jgi:hypothetical protein